MWKIFEDIAGERNRQIQKHGERSISGPSLDNFERTAIVAEEAGEVARATLDLASSIRKSYTTAVQNGREHLREELVQLGACAVGWLQRLDVELGDRTGELYHTIFADIRAVRREQDVRWGGPAHDDTHSRGEWLAYLRGQLHELGNYSADGGPPFRHRLVAIAALAVAAVESFDRKHAVQT